MSSCRRRPVFAGRWCVLGFALVPLVHSPWLHAEPTSADKAMATQLYDDAEKEMARANYAVACSKYGESERLDPQLGTLLHLADCYEKAGKTASAWASFKEAIEVAARKNAGGGNEPREKTARARTAALEVKLSRLTLAVNSPDTPGLEIQQDGQVVGRPMWGSSLPVDPGAHTLAVKAPGRKTWTKVVDVGANGAKVDVAVPSLEPDRGTSAPASTPSTTDAPQQRALPLASPEAPSTSSSQRTIGFAVGGAGVVGLAVGAVFLAKRSSTLTERDGLCPNDVCKDGGEAAKVADLTDQAKRSTTNAMISFGAGRVALIAGAVLVLTAPTERSSPTTAVRFAPWAGSTSVGAAVTGHW